MPIYFYIVLALLGFLGSVILREFGHSMPFSKAFFITVIMGYLISLIYKKVRKILGIPDPQPDTVKELQKTTDGKHFIKK